MKLDALMAYSLSPSQQLALLEIKQFLLTTDANTFILNGYAGTGKTFLMQELGKLLTIQKQQFVFLASTGRAASVLRGKTGFDAKTVHSELYHFNKVEGDGEHILKESSVDSYGQMKLVFGLRGKDEVTKLYIVDEASMISSDIGTDSSFAEFGSGRLLVDLLEIVGDNKIIFVGDPCQLPPIGESFSPALEIKWLKEQGRNIKSATLSEILRTNEDNGILVLAKQVRSFFKESFSSRYVKLPALKKQNITIHINSNILLKEYINQFLIQKPQTNMAICRSNSDCQAINKLIRLKKYEIENAPLQIGDTLLVTQNNHLIPLTNGDFIEVLAIGEKKTKANLQFINVKVKALQSDKDYEILLCLDILYGNQTNISHEQNRLLMIEFSRSMKYKAIKANSLLYKDAMLKDPFLNSLRATYGYAVTCHKAQGGEWDNIYLFLNKGMYSMEHNELFRWWYTAITRARKELHIHIDWWII